MKLPNYEVPFFVTFCPQKKLVLKNWTALKPTRVSLNNCFSFRTTQQLFDKPRRESLEKHFLLPFSNLDSFFTFPSLPQKSFLVLIVSPSRQANFFKEISWTLQFWVNIDWCFVGVTCTRTKTHNVPKRIWSKDTVRRLWSAWDVNLTFKIIFWSWEEKVTNKEGKYEQPQHMKQLRILFFKVLLHLFPL